MDRFRRLCCSELRLSDRSLSGCFLKVIPAISGSIEIAALVAATKNSREFVLGFGRGFQQRARVVVLGARSDFFGRAEFDDFSAAHYSDAIA
jgi:hypothetical protein